MRDPFPPLEGPGMVSPGDLEFGDVCGRNLVRAREAHATGIAAIARPWPRGGGSHLLGTAGDFKIDAESEQIPDPGATEHGPKHDQDDKYDCNSTHRSSSESPHHTHTGTIIH